MAWVNRTSRDEGPGSFQVRTAAAHLGPGAYESPPVRRVKPNVAPFGSTAQPERGANASSEPGTIGQSFVTPGPGAYEATDNQRPWESPSKQSSAVFQSKTQREIGGDKTLKASNQTPGPGTYMKQDSFGMRGKKKKKQNTPHVGNLQTPSTPKTNIKWARLPSAPSIPTHAQSFGYEQGPYGKLVRHEPANLGHSGRGDDTIGPGDYDPIRGLKSIHKPRATDFSRSRVTRSFEKEIKQRADLPGPGQYVDASSSMTKNTQRASSVFKSVITREKAAIVAGDTSKQPVPGPGTYFEGYKDFSSAAKPEYLQFFGSTSTRFDPTAQRETMCVPGPGTYYSPPTFTAKPQSMRRKGNSAPFSTKKERFDYNNSGKKDEYLAAPGSYNMPLAMADTLNKVSSRVQTFGSTTKRFDSSSSCAETGAIESQLEREMRLAQDEATNVDNGMASHVRHSNAKPSAMFASSSVRFKSLEKSVAPSPGDYEVQASWNASGATGTFKSATDRLKSKSTQAANVPGPGAYTPPVAVNFKPVHVARPDVFVGAEPRFKKILPKVQAPGPGAYSSHSIENDWNRPTYNITIATEMELAMLR